MPVPLRFDAVVEDGYAAVVLFGADEAADGLDEFDAGLAVGEYSFPPLTTVRQDFKRHGREMVGLVLEQAASGELDRSRSIIIPTELIVRGSTAPPAP